MKKYYKKNELVAICIIILSFFNCIEKGTKSRKVSVEITDSISFILNEELLRENYADFEGYYPPEGYVGTPELAAQLADAILSSIYGKEKIANQMPFLINLDNGIWVIEGCLDEGLRGGSAYIEIDMKTGAILKLLHTK